MAACSAAVISLSSLPGPAATMLRWMPIIRSGWRTARNVATAEPQSPPWAPKRS